MSKRLLHEPYSILKLRLAGLGLTYDDVANAINIKSRTSVQKKINGQSDFKISEQDLMCKKFGITKNDFR